MRPIGSYARFAPVALGALALLAGVLGSRADETHGARGGADPRPNIVLVVTDDQTLASLTGRAMPYTVTSVAGQGTTFNNTIATTPLCCPSRATMITGQYGHNNGVVNNKPGYPALQDKRNVLPTWLSKAGYATAHVGRYLNEYPNGRRSRPAPGWDKWIAMLEPRSYYDYELHVGRKVVEVGDKARDYATRVLTSRSVALIEEFVPRDKPFYLQLDHMAPHAGTGVKQGPCRPDEMADPEPKDEGLFASEPLPNPPSFNEQDVSDKPSFVQKVPPLSERLIAQITARWRCALGSLVAVDRSMAALDAALAAAGELENTVVMLISDNGFFYGEHRLPREKIRPYEESLRVPFIARVPPGVLGAPAVPTVNELVANIDVVPTILEFAGAAPCVSQGHCRVMDGRSLVPLLRGDGTWPQDRGLLLEFRTNDDTFGTSSSCAYQGIRTPGHSYVVHTSVPDRVTDVCEPADEREHYDLAADPFQLQNLYPGDPLGAGLVQEQLHARLVSLVDCAGVEGRDPLPPSGHFCE